MTNFHLTIELATADYNTTHDIFLGAMRNMNAPNCESARGDLIRQIRHQSVSFVCSVKLVALF